MSRKKVPSKVELFLPNNGSKTVSPEKLVSGQKLAITINPDKQYYQLAIDPSDRFISWSSNVYKQLKELKYIESLILYPEISQTGRLHLHGYIIIKDIAEFYLSDLPRLIIFAHVEIDTLSQDQKGLDIYDNYITKCVPLMKVLTETNIHYNQHGAMIVQYPDRLLDARSAIRSV